MSEAPITSPLTMLDEATCWTRLAEHWVGRLVVAVGSQPDIFPVNYLLDDGEIVIRTAEGTKLAAAIMGGRVAFEIDEFDADTRAGWSVVVHGTARESHTMDEALHDDELDTSPWADGAKERVLHVIPEQITGRTLGPQPTEEPS